MGPSPGLWFKQEAGRGTKKRFQLALGLNMVEARGWPSLKEAPFEGAKAQPYVAPNPLSRSRRIRTSRDSTVLSCSIGPVWPIDEFAGLT